MKRFLFIYGQLGGGGAERVLLDILKNFDYSCNAVDLCIQSAGGILYEEIPPEVKIIPLWKGYSIGYKFCYHISNIFGIDYFIRRKMRNKLQDNYDLVISFLEGLPLKLHAIANFLHGRQISWVHCDLLRFPYEKNQFRKQEEIHAYNKMDKIICVAEDTARAFKQRFPLCTSSILSIYNPIDIDKIVKMSTEYIVENNIFTIVTVGRLTPPKKMDRIIRLAKRFKDENYNIRFKIIGEGELRPNLEHQISELNVNGMVELLGFKKNPFPLIKSADMMFCCSGYEGFCLAICEAMALGVPVVSTETSGTNEILCNSKYGLLCKHDDDSMYCSIKKMLKNEDLRKHYADIGKMRVMDFSIDKTMDQIYKL